MSAYHLDEFKAAVQLNNTAVSLLERRCYRQAVSTLCDAISIIGSTTSYRPTDRTESHDPHVITSVRAAAQRLSNPQPCSEEHAHNMSVHVLSDDENPAVIEPCFLESLKIWGSNDSPGFRGNAKYHVVRMESVDLGVSTGYVSVLSSIVLYNYSIGFLCLGSLSTSSTVREQLDRGAFQLLAHADSTLSSTELSDESNPCLLMNLILLLQLVDMAPTLGEECEDYMNRLRNLKERMILPLYLLQLPAQPAPVA
jgi:hypothetical protein